MAQAQKQKPEFHKEDRTPFIPAIDMRIFWRSTIITFILGFIGFLIIFIYIATH